MKIKLIKLENYSFLLYCVGISLFPISFKVFSFPISDIFFILASLVYLFICIKNRINFIGKHNYWLCALLLFIGGVLSLTYSVNQREAVITTIKSIFLFSIWLSLSIHYATSEPRYNVIITIFLVGCASTALIACFDRLTGLMIGPKIVELTYPSNNINLEWTAQNLGRYSGLMIHPNIMGNYISIGICFLLGKIYFEKKSFHKSLFFCFLFCIFFYGIILTGSIASLGSTIIGIIILTLFWIRINPKRILYLLIGFMILTIFIISNYKNILESDISTQLSQNISRVSNTTSSIRMNANIEGFNKILKNPIFGYGMEQASNDLNSFNKITSEPIHNTLIKTWISGGIFAFLGLLTAYFISLSTVIKTIIKIIKNKKEYIILSGVAVAISVAIAIDMVQPSFYQRFAWISSALLVGRFYFINNKSKLKTI